MAFLHTNDEEKALPWQVKLIFAAWIAFVVFWGKNVYDCGLSFGHVIDIAFFTIIGILVYAEFENYITDFAYNLGLLFLSFVNLAETIIRFINIEIVVVSIIVTIIFACETIQSTRKY